MLANKFLANFKRDRKVRDRRIDVVAEQVKEMLKTSDQKLILMVRG